MKFRKESLRKRYNAWVAPRRRVSIERKLLRELGCPSDRVKYRVLRPHPERITVSFKGKPVFHVETGRQLNTGDIELRKRMNLDAFMAQSTPEKMGQLHDDLFSLGHLGVDPATGTPVEVKNKLTAIQVLLHYLAPKPTDTLVQEKRADSQPDHVRALFAVLQGNPALLKKMQEMQDMLMPAPELKAVESHLAPPPPQQQQGALESDTAKDVKENPV